MKKNFTPFFGLLLAAVCQLAIFQSAQAQGNQNDNFLFRVTAGNQIVDYPKGGDCGFGYAAFGASVTEELCGELAWAYDITPDSLVCDTVIGDLTGKIAMVRRGTCNFSIKAYYAQQAGAVGVIVFNHYATATDNECTYTNMAAGTFAELVTIPVINLGRGASEFIDASLANGPVEGCFLLPRFLEPSFPYHYQTPVTQVDTFGNIQVRYINRDAADQTDVVIKADISGPNGYTASISSTVPTVTPGEDIIVPMPAYLPPAVIGKYDVVFSNNKYNESRDSLHGSFEISEYTYGMDNRVLDPQGVGTTNANFISGGFIRQEGALAITGPDGGIATHVSFSIANIDSVFVPGAPAGSTVNDILVFVYDGDADGDNNSDISAGFDDLTQIGYGTYTMTGDEVDGEMISVEVTDVVSGLPVELQGRHLYYSSLLYNGLEAGYGRDIRFSNTLEEWTFLNFPSTPLMVGNGTALTLFSGWAGITTINRLHLQGFQPATSVKKPEQLAENQVVVTPNPANDFMRIDLDLNAVSDKVTLTLFDNIGRVAASQTTSNFQNGQLNFDVKSLPSGMYLLWVRTAEGMTMRKVAICH